MTKEFYTSVSVYGDNILYRGYRDGHSYKIKIPYKPKFYIESKTGKQDFVTLYGKEVSALEFEGIRDAKNFMKEYKDIDVDIYGMPNYVCQFLQEAYPYEAQADFDLVRIGSIDIETTAYDGFPNTTTTEDAITAIGLHMSNTKIMHVWTTAVYDTSKYKYTNHKLDYRFFSNEKDMLRDYISWWKDPINTPDVMTGWNIRGFDIPYIVNRLYRVLGASDESITNKLSPWNKAVQETTFTVKGRKNDTYTIPGIEVIDYMDLFMKFGVLTYGPQESYSLDSIAKVVLGTTKEKYNGSLDELYENDPQLFIDYNVKDVDLIVRFEEEMQLIALSFSIAYKAGVNPSETLGTTNIWESIIYRFCQSRNIIIPPKKHKQKTPYPGGYVKEPIAGFWDWVVSFDLASLYPKLIEQYNMSPETLLEGVNHQVSVDSCINDVWPDIEEGVSTTPNGVRFSNEKLGMMPQIIDKLYTERKIAKNVMIEASKKLETKGLSESEKHKWTIEKVVNNNKQMAIKILMNSMYGAMGSQYFTYFNQDIAEAITLSGQLSIKVAEKAINGYMNSVLQTDKKDYIIAIDTDSNYVNFAPLVNKVFKNRMDDKTKIVEFLDQICSSKFEPVIDAAYKNLAIKTNAYSQQMVMEREAIADVGIWAAKKRYILRVHNNEGVQYAKPKIKIMGLEAVKSSTPEVCRDKFKEVFEIILDKDQDKLHQYVSAFKTHFFSLEPHQVAFPRSVSNITKWVGVDKGLPIHVRASVNYNRALDRHQLSRQYQHIKNGSKIKFSYCKMPNPLRDNVIAFQNDELPKDIGMHAYIDYQKQFDKTFVDPLTIVLDCIKWSAEPVASFDALFDF